VNTTADREFSYHRNSAGDIRKFRSLWQYRPVSNEERRVIWLRIVYCNQWLSRIAPTLRDKQVIYALCCLFPDVPLNGQSQSSWQKKNMHYRGRGYTNDDGTQFTLRDAAIIFFKQRGRCQICQPDEPYLDMRPNAPVDTRACADDNHNDHRHIRGLLCDLHNKGLGHMKESRGGLGRATSYLHERGDYEC